VDIEFLIQRLEQYLLDESPKLPLSGSRAVNEKEVRSRLAQLQEAIPQEIARAQQIIERQEALLQEATRQAEQIVAEAEREAKRLADEHRIVKKAEAQANAILEQSRQNAVSLRVEADEYVFDELSKLQAELKRSLRVVENGLKKLETDRERRLED
jgi:cell division septum initiation protein DivIVA